MNQSDTFQASLFQDQQNNTLVIENLKRKNEDLQQRLDISEKLRNDFQQTIQKSNEQDHILHLQQINSLNEKLEKVKNANSSLECDLKSSNMTIDSLKSQIIFLENSQRIKDQKILEISMTCFKTSFNNIDDLLSFMMTQPKYYEEERLEFNKNQEKLLKKIKSEKSKRNTLQSQIEHIQNNFDQRVLSYEEKINDLQSEIKSLKNQISSTVKEADQKIISLQTKIATTRKPKLFLYNEPPISIPGKTIQKSVVDELREKLKISNVYVKDLKSKNKKLEANIELLTTDFKNQVEETEKVSKELKTAQLLREEIEKQLQTVRTTFEAQKDDRVKLKQKIKEQKKFIDSQVESIQQLNRTISGLEIKISELEIHITRIKSEDDDQKNKRDFDATERSKSIETLENQLLFQNQISPCSSQISYADCYTAEIPTDIEPQIRSIVMNQSLQPLSKIKMVLKTVCPYYAEQIDNLKEKNTLLNNQLTKYISSFSDFIPKLTSPILNKQIPVNDFIDDPTIQSKTLAILRRKCENSNDFPQLQNDVLKLTEETENLYNKIRKYKKKISEDKEHIDILQNNNQEKANSILQLQTKVKYLQKKVNESQSTIDKQKREFMVRLENSKNQTEVEYAKIIDVLKKKYNDQQNLVNDLSSKLALHHLT